MKKITISYKIGQYLIFEFFPVLEESRVFPLFDDISHMILFAIYLDYLFIYWKQMLFQVCCAQNTISSTLLNDQSPEIYRGLGTKRENPDPKLMK